MSDKIAEMYDPSKLKQFSLDSIEYISDLGEGQFGLVFQGNVGFLCNHALIIEIRTAFDARVDV